MQALKLIGFVSILGCSGNLDVGKDERGGSAGTDGEPPGGFASGGYTGAIAGADVGGGLPVGGSSHVTGGAPIGGSNYEPVGGYGQAGNEQGGYGQAGAWPVGGFNAGGGTNCSDAAAVGGHSVGGWGIAGAGNNHPCSPPPPPDWPGPCDDCEPVAASGTWEGYEEDFFLMPTEKWSVTIDGAREGELSGTVTFGEGEIEPASDPTEVYPPSNTGGYILQRGATYRIVRGAARDAIVRFQIAAGEIMQSWCSLQDSYAFGNGYAPLPSPDWRFSENGTCQMLDRDGTLQSFSIHQCNQASYCACDKSGCAARIEGLVTFDLHFDARAGTLTGTTTDGRSLRLERVDAN